MEVITICGSRRFKFAIERINAELTMQGNAVFSLGVYSDVRPDQKELLDAVHRRKIDLSDAIYVVNIKGYIGQSTRNEIHYAMELGKKVYFLPPSHPENR